MNCFLSRIEYGLNYIPSGLLCFINQYREFQVSMIRRMRSSCKPSKLNQHFNEYLQDKFVFKTSVLLEYILRKLP